MPINLSGISNVTTAALSLSNLVLVTPKAIVGYQPKNPPNPDGTVSKAELPPTLLFHYEGEQSVTVTSDITDHFVEDNSPVEDNIAVRPEIYRTRGFIGELNNVPPPGLKALNEVANRLDTITAYAPQVSSTAQLAYAQALAAYQLASNVANTAVAAWSSINKTGGNGPQNLQQEYFQRFYGYQKEKRLFMVQTPWAVFDNMAIQELRVIQDEETQAISTFELTFKAFRTVQTMVTGFDSRALDGRAASQSSPLTDYGVGSLGPSESFSMSAFA